MGVGGPMGREEWFGNWGVRGDFAEDMGGKVGLGGGRWEDVGTGEVWER